MPHPLAYNAAILIVALVFVIFDIESLYLYPWAIIFRTLGWTGFGSMTIFVAVLFFGLIYTWRRGALNWPDRSGGTH